MLQKNRKWNCIKCSIKLQKAEKRVEDKSRDKEQGQWIENMVSNVVNINPTISIIILNVNSLNVPIKRQIVRVDPKTRLSYISSTTISL